MGYDKRGEMDQPCGALPDVTPHATIDGEVKVENRRNRDCVRYIMRRIGRSRVNRCIGEQRTIVIRVCWISLIARRVDPVRGVLGQLHVRRSGLQAQLRGCKR